MMIPAHESPLAALAFNPSGTRLATASEKGTVIRVFSVEEGTKLIEFRRGVKRCATVYCLAFSQDSQYLVSDFAPSQTISIHTVQQMGTVHYHNTLTSFIFCPLGVELQHGNHSYLQVRGRGANRGKSATSAPASRVKDIQRTHAVIHPWPNLEPFRITVLLMTLLGWVIFPRLSLLRQATFQPKSRTHWTRAGHSPPSPFRPPFPLHPTLWPSQLSPGSKGCSWHQQMDTSTSTTCLFQVRVDTLWWCRGCALLTRFFSFPIDPGSEGGECTLVKQHRIDPDCTVPVPIQRHPEDPVRSEQRIRKDSEDEDDFGPASSPSSPSRPAILDVIKGQQSEDEWSLDFQMCTCSY